MLRIRALNEEYNNDDEDFERTTNRKPTREAQEQEAVELYNSSFELIAEGKYDEAISTLETILDLPFFEEEFEKKCSPVQLQIKLGCLKALSTIYYSLDPNPDEAVKVLKMALALDPTNVTLWYRLGMVAIKVTQFELAFSAFAQGFESSSNHWGCLENLITLSYLLFDNTTCLEYCALGLARDAGFIRGLVFRDHIFRLQPSVKEKTVAKWDVLKIEQSYSKDWEQKYLSEVQNLLRNQAERAEEELRVEKREASAVFVCRHRMKTLTFSELCRILLFLYQDAKLERALLRPVQLILKDEFTAPLSVPTSQVMEMDQSAPDTNDEISHGSLPVSRPSVEMDVKRIPNGIESGAVSVLEGSESILENGDKSADDSQMNDRSTEKEREDDGNRDQNKKKKRDIKWWQLEGKRRSQRVRGHLVSASAPVKHLPNKETEFATKLKSIFPKSLLDEELEVEPNQKSSLTSPSVSQISHNYFGTDEEAADVQQFIAERTQYNTMDLLIELTQLLGNKADRNWPTDLGTNYIQLYSLYRNHVPQPDPFSGDVFIRESLPLECRITLTVLELSREKLTSVQKLRSDENFNVNLFFVSEVCRVIDDPTLLLRFNWFLVNYHISLTSSGHSSFASVKFYLEELEHGLSEGLSIAIPTQTDSLISLEEVRKKMTVIQRSENVNRVNELYESKNYAELIEILPFYAKSDGTEGLSLANRFYLADSYFQLQRYGDCHLECLKITKEAKLPSNSQTLQKTVILLKRVVRIPEYEIPLALIRQTIVGMITLLSDKRPHVFAILPISPWCILHKLLFKLEQQDPAVYLDEDSSPPSILILQFAHEQLGRGGKCALNKGKLLNYTLDSLLPLVSNENYSDHENLKHCIEQAIFCLFGHPTKVSKCRYLSDHGNPNVMLDLVRSRQLYEYYRPEKLPEFDSYNSISEADASLFLRIVALIPPEEKPEDTFNKIKIFLNGDSEELLSEVKGGKDFDPKFYDIFYLLGDHYFKVKDWPKSIEYYTWDLAVTSVRFDSWAGIALAKAERITTQLTCGNFKIMEIMSIANVAVKCFQNALELDPSNSKLRIEFGSFLYSMHSFCSRLLKQNTDQLSLDHFDLIEAKKEEFLARSARCFEPVAARNGNDSKDDNVEQHEEVWIHHYMLGKVMEKLDPHSPAAFLEQYEMAGKLLHEHGAMYPMKISFYSPQELAIEALEIFYRIHASILNYIEKHDYTVEMEEKLLSYVERERESPFMKAKLKRPESATESKRKKQEKVLADVKNVLEDMIGRVEEIVKADEAHSVHSPKSSSTRSSSVSSTEDSSDTSTDSNSAPEPTPRPVSFGLSVFQDKLRETELRERKLIEAARISEEKKKLLSNASNSEAGSLKSAPPAPTVPIPDEDSHWKDIKYGKVIAYCIKAMQECITRFPAHHKSYFRISYTYSTFCKTHIRVSRDWLLGSGTSAKKKVMGLFGDRKPSNFFNGVWRNPIDDIDRPGSFPYHMSKTIQNLLEVLNSLDDHEMLTEVGIQLAKVPESDKKYLYNFEREQFSLQATTSATSAAKRLINSAGSRLPEVAMGIYSSYLKIQKSNLLKDNGMSPILVAAYEKYLISKGMAPEAQALTVEVALKHYQHVSWTTKIKASQTRGTTPMGLSKELPRKSSKRSMPVQMPTGSSTLPTGSLPALAPRMVPIPVSVPHAMPQVTLFNALLSSSSTSTQAKASSGSQPIRRKPPIIPAPLMLKQGGNDPSNRLTGREVPSLVTIPTAAENYIRQFGLMPMLPTITTSNQQSSNMPIPSPTFPYLPPSSTSASEEYILPDLITSSPTKVPWLGNVWNPNGVSTSATSATLGNSFKKDKSISSSDQKLKQLNAQAKEAIAMFENNRYIWDTSNYYNTSDSSKTSLHANQHPILGIGNLTKKNEFSNLLYSSSEQSEQNAYSMFQAKGQVTKKPPLTAKPRRASDATPVVKRIPINTKGRGKPSEPKQNSNTSMFSGSIILEGETLPVVGNRGDSVPSPAVVRKEGIIAAPTTDPQARLAERRAKELLKTREPRSRRAVSPSILRSPPTSIPLSTISTFNTSPFKAQSTMVSNPGQFIKGQTEAQVYNRRAATPPAAHSANKTPPHASSAGFPEIIDLTTKSPIKQTPLIPSTSQMATTLTIKPKLAQANGNGNGRGVKRPIPQMIAIGGQPSLESAPAAGHSLPPKKKLAMRKVDAGVPVSHRPPALAPAPASAARTVSDSETLEIITID